VEPGDLIEIGSHRFLFEKAEPPKATGEDSLVRQAIWRNAWRDSIEQGDSEEKQQESSLVSGNTFSGALTMDWPSSSGGQPLRSPLHMTRPLGGESASSPEHVLQSGANSESGEYVPDGFISHGVDAWEETVILDYDAVMPQVLAPPSVFVIRSGVMEGQSFFLDRPLLTIGRGSESDVVVRDSSISRRHAQFIRQADGDYVLDLASRNGTKVNNEPLRAPHLLQHGDVISMGNVCLEYTSALEAGTTPLPPLSLPSLIRSDSGPVPLRLPSKPRSE